MNKLEYRIIKRLTITDYILLNYYLVKQNMQYTVVKVSRVDDDTYDVYVDSDENTFENLLSSAKNEFKKYIDELSIS